MNVHLAMIINQLANSRTGPRGKLPRVWDANWKNIVR